MVITEGPKFHHVKAKLEPGVNSTLELNGKPFGCRKVSIDFEHGGVPVVTLSFYARVEVEATTDDLTRAAISRKVETEQTEK
jgi:hypothetical protein